MRRWIGTLLLSLAATLTVGRPALPCNLCPSMGSGATLRQDAAKAKLVLYCTIANARLNANDPLGTGGVTDLRIDSVLKSDPFLGNKKVVEINRYVPPNPKAPVTFLVFCDVYNGKLDPYRGVEVKSPAIVDYLKGALALEGKDRSEALLYFFSYLDHRDAEVATDAFLEFARASDQEIGLVARHLSAERLRQLLQNPLTRPERIGLFAFLLGACGGDKDADFLRQLMRRPHPNTTSALGGLLSGYMELRPREGWELALKLLAEENRQFIERFSVLGTLRFYHGWKPEESKRDVLRGLAVLLPQGDIADLAIEDLRRWQYWDLTPDVLAQFGKKSHDAPIMKRAILRYAMSCPQPEAEALVRKTRKQDPELIKDVEEALQFEKAK